MKLITTKSTKRGIAMTEYLIILAIVAVAAIAVVGLFGKQVKSAFTRSNSALVGKVEAADTATADKSKTDVIADHMGTFTEKVADQ
jgi:pilus assembly protein Flp/PilA